MTFPASLCGSPKENACFLGNWWGGNGRVGNHIKNAKGEDYVLRDNFA